MQLQDANKRQSQAGQRRPAEAGEYSQWLQHKHLLDICVLLPRKLNRKDGLISGKEHNGNSKVV